MQFTADTNRRQKSFNRRHWSVPEGDESLYEYSINLYTIPPFGKISLEYAEDAVAERLNRK